MSPAHRDDDDCDEPHLSRPRALVSTGATGAIATELFEGHNVKNIFLGNFLRKLLVKNFLAPELLES